MKNKEDLILELRTLVKEFCDKDKEKDAKNSSAAKGLTHFTACLGALRDRKCLQGDVVGVGVFNKKTDECELVYAMKVRDIVESKAILEKLHEVLDIDPDQFKRRDE